jgi:prepilin-type N-terminal cleavage/methylation domain-containing protein
MPANTETNRVSEAGFSMIEILVVVLIIATVLAFTVPMAANSIRAYNLRSAADHMAERIAAVRALAMAKNRNVTFSLNDSSLKYGFDFDGTEGDGVPDISDPDDTSTLYNVETLREGLTTTFPDGDPIKVTFNSRGELPIGDTEQAIVLQYSGRSVTVRVNLRGKISVE